MKDAIDETVLKLRIVVLALVLGVASFGAIAYFLVRGSDFSTDSSLQIPLVGALGALIIGLLVTYPVLQRNLVTRSDDGSVELAECLTIYSTLVIIRSAMIEGIGLFGGVLYLLTAHVVGLLAIAGSIALLLARLPSREGAEAFSARMGQIR